MTESTITELIPDANWPAPDTSFIKTQFTDVPYASDSPLQKMDIYLPGEGSGPFPLVAFFHGGGFTSGDKRDGQLTSLLRVLERGYALASINYRFAPEAVFPGQIQDAKAAIKHLRENAPAYNLNGKVVAWGTSAGGYLASFLGTLTGIPAPGQRAEDANSLSDVDAVVDWFGPVDFASDENEEQQNKEEVGIQMRTAETAAAFMFFGGDPNQDPLLAKRIRPVSYLSKRTPPFIIQHGTADEVVPLQQSIAFATALQYTLGEEQVKLTILEGANHGGEPFQTKENFDTIFEFLNNQLNKEHYTTIRKDE